MTSIVRPSCCARCGQPLGPVAVECNLPVNGGKEFVRSFVCTNNACDGCEHFGVPKQIAVNSVKR